MASRFPSSPRLVALAFLAQLASLQADPFDLAISVDPTANRLAISPLIYGANQEIDGAPVTLRRFGGNRVTGYNWENNASNAGSDWYHNSDSFMTSGMSAERARIPGIAVTDFHDAALSRGVSCTLITLPMAGYVARDKNGTVSVAETAPSARWVEVRNTKPGPLASTPDTSDNFVYTDEFIQFLVDRYGHAGTPTGVRAYAFDNEPDLWSHTHARIHPTDPTCAELLERSIDLATTVKRIDPLAETYGFVSYGFSGYYSFQGASDWEAIKAGSGGRYRWFVDYFLDRMRQAGDAAGKRLLDVIDLHNYTEHSAGGSRVPDNTDYSNLECNKGRMQAPRGLWDPTFAENSWIGQWFADFLPLLPTCKASIEAFYPGTKLAITEYNAGGESHISGGIAQADYLGIFGKYGVYSAALWQLHDGAAYAAAAFRLYRDYDGQGGKFGDTSVAATCSNTVEASAYASVDSADPSKLHLILLNKNYDESAVTTVDLAGARSYQSARVFAFDSSGSTLTERTPLAPQGNNHFSVTVPRLTAMHLVFESSSALPEITTQPLSTTVVAGQPTSLNVTATGTGPLSYQWYRNGAQIAGATAAALSLANVSSAEAGLYDVAVTSSETEISQPAVVGVLPPSGSRTAGAVSTRDEWQNIQHPNGHTYDQFLMSGSAGTFTADPGEIARMSFLDPQGSIVQVEMSGAGAITVALDPTSASGPKTPTLYNQSGVEYMQGKATIILAGADETTHFTIYSVGTATNPGVTKPDVNYSGWADIAAAGIITTDGKLGGIHQGNANYNATVGYAGLYAPGVATVNGLVVIHDIAASDFAQPLLQFAPGGTVNVKIAGGSLSQPNSDDITVDGLAKLTMGAGQDSCGRDAGAKTIAAALVTPDGTDVTTTVVTGP